MNAWQKPLQSWRREMQAGGLTDGTIRLRTAHLRQFADHHPDGPAAITRHHLIDWLARPRSAEYRRSVRSSLRTFFAWAEAEGLVHRSPAARLPAVRAPRRQPRPAGDDVIIDALTVAPARTLLMIRMMAELGLRRAETAGSDVEDVEDAGLRVLGKGGVVRVVPLPRDLRSVLAGLPAGPVFPGRAAGGHLSPGHVGRLVTAALPAGVVPHQLRHAAATAWRRRGLSLEVIRDLLGHASVRTTEVYVMSDLEGAQEVIEQAAARMPMDARRTVDARQAVAGYLAGRIDAAIDGADSAEDAVDAVRAILIGFVGSAAGERGHDGRDQSRHASGQRAVHDQLQPLRLVREQAGADLEGADVLGQVPHIGA